MQMLGKPPGVQSAEKGHFKRQPHVNLPEHDYRILYIHTSFSQLSAIYRMLYGSTPISVIALQGYGAFFCVRVVLEQLKQEMKILGVICEFSLLQLVFIRTYQIAQHIHCPLHATYIFVYKFGKRAVRFSEFVSWFCALNQNLSTTAMNSSCLFL